jgi:TonB family protein
MKNLPALMLIILVLSFAELACKNPLSAYTKQYKCELPGQPEPVTAEDHIDRAYKHVEENNYKADPAGCALGACSEAVRLDPTNPDAWYCRASMYRLEGERDKALADMDEAIRLNPDQAQFYALRGLLYADKNMWDKGLPDITKKLELLGSDATHFDYWSRGNFYYELGKYDDAVKDYSEAIRLRPDYRYHYSDRAKAYEKLGKTDLAAADKKKAEELELTEKNKDAGETPIKLPSSVNSDVQTVSGGVLNGKALSLPTPVYPPAARAVRASGAVNVQIFVNEKGEVTGASAVSGHPLLRMAAVQAARSTKFPPTLLSGKPVKVTGVLTFNFTL